MSRNKETKFLAPIGKKRLQEEENKKKPEEPVESKHSDLSKERY